MIQNYPSTRAVRADSYAVLISWVLILICVILWGLAITLRLPLDDLLTFSGKAFLIAAGIHFILAFTHSCPVCGKHPTIQGFGQVHPASFTQSKLKGWSGVSSASFGAANSPASIAERISALSQNAPNMAPNLAPSGRWTALKRRRLALR